MFSNFIDYESTAFSCLKEIEDENKKLTAQIEKKRKEAEKRTKSVKKLLDDAIFGKQEDTNKTILITLKYLMDKVEELEKSVSNVNRNISNLEDTIEDIERKVGRIY